MAALTGCIQRLKEINSTKKFRESPNAGSEGTTSEIPVLVSEEVDLEVENNLGAEIDSGIRDFSTTQGDCEDRQIKPGIDVDKGKGEAEEMISNSGRFIKLTSPVAPEAAICEERNKEKEEQKDDEEEDMESSDADNAEAGKSCEKEAKEGEAQPRNSSDLERILMVYNGELAEEKKILDDDAKSDEQTSGEDEMRTEQGMTVASGLGFWISCKQSSLCIFGEAFEMLIPWIFGFLTWRKELVLIDEGQIGSYSVFSIFSGFHGDSRVSCLTCRPKTTLGQVRKKPVRFGSEDLLTS
ncbi:hypothetical protein U1Q18_003298 [Sarracenia purpurea var. burkii]